MTSTSLIFESRDADCRKCEGSRYAYDNNEFMCTPILVKNGGSIEFNNWSIVEQSPEDNKLTHLRVLARLGLNSQQRIGVIRGIYYEE